MKRGIEKKKNKQKEETFSFPPGFPQSSPFSVPKHAL
jgi:hypothetical protein